MHRLGARDLAALLKALVAWERGGDAQGISKFYVNRMPGDPRRFPMEMEMAQRVDVRRSRLGVQTGSWECYACATYKASRKQIEFIERQQARGKTG